MLLRLLSFVITSFVLICDCGLGKFNVAVKKICGQVLYIMLISLPRLVSSFGVLTCALSAFFSAPKRAL